MEDARTSIQSPVRQAHSPGAACGEYKEVCVRALGLCLRALGLCVFVSSDGQGLVVCCCLGHCGCCLIARNILALVTRAPLVLCSVLCTVDHILGWAWLDVGLLEMP